LGKLIVVVVVVSVCVDDVFVFGVVRVNYYVVVVVVDAVVVVGVCFGVV
jgi:hypothetical protein